MSLIFFKITPDNVTLDNYTQNVMTMSAMDSPISTLYHAVQKVYSPLLLKDGKWGGTFDARLQVLPTALFASTVCFTCAGDLGSCARSAVVDQGI